MRTLALACVLLTACNEAVELDEDDHSAERLVLEGDQIIELVGEDLVSAPIQSTAGFRRLGLMWDATAQDALEVRTSLDGSTWSAWTSPSITSSEDIAHAGHVDAFDVGDAGSLDSDPRARWYQLRVPEGRALPTFIVVEPLADIPSPFDRDLDVQLPDEDAGAETAEIAALVRSTPIGSVRIHSRADWGARRPRCASATATPNRATIHHTVTPTNDSMTVPQRLRQIQRFHMYSRGWCDIGYNFLISRDGRVWRGRGARKIGAHVTNANTGNVGISFIGTYTSTAPTQTQMCNAAKLLRRLSADYSGLSLNRTDVKGHRQYGGTACPGNALYSRIDTILRKARGGCGVN